MLVLRKEKNFESRSIPHRTIVAGTRQLFPSKPLSRYSFISYSSFTRPLSLWILQMIQTSLPLEHRSVVLFMNITPFIAHTVTFTRTSERLRRNCFYIPIKSNKFNVDFPSSSSSLLFICVRKRSMQICEELKASSE